MIPFSWSYSEMPKICHKIPTKYGCYGILQFNPNIVDYDKCKGCKKYPKLEERGNEYK